MSNYLISVIIPAYNAEKTIEKCIKSISSNTVEIIVVVDGANDKTEEICKSLQKEMNNLKIIVQKNQGQFIARKSGIDNALGKYIMFLDSDDNYCENTIIEVEDLIKKYNEPDLIRFRYEKPNEYQQYIYFEKEKFIEKKDFKELVYPMFFKTYMLNALFTDCVEKDVLEKICIKQLDLRYGEDLLLNLEIFTNIKNVLFTNKILYKYITKKESITQTKDIGRLLKNLEDAIKVYSTLYEYLLKWDMQTEQNIELVNNKVIEETTRLIKIIRNINC